MTFALVFHAAAPTAYFVNAALDNQQIFFSTPDQNAGKPSLIVKGQLVQLRMPGGQFLKMQPAARHLAALQKRAVQVIFDPGVIKAVQIGEL